MLNSYRPPLVHPCLRSRACMYARWSTANGKSYKIRAVFPALWSCYDRFDVRMPDFFIAKWSSCVSLKVPPLSSSSVPCAISSPSLKEAAIDGRGGSSSKRKGASKRMGTTGGDGGGSLEDSVAWLRLDDLKRARAGRGFVEKIESVQDTNRVFRYLFRFVILFLLLCRHLLHE